MQCSEVLHLLCRFVAFYICVVTRPGDLLRNVTHTCLYIISKQSEWVGHMAAWDLLRGNDRLDNTNWSCSSDCCRVLQVLRNLNWVGDSSASAAASVIRRLHQSLHHADQVDLNRTGFRTHQRLRNFVWDGRKQSPLSVEEATCVRGRSSANCRIDQQKASRKPSHDLQSVVCELAKSVEVGGG